MGAGGIWGNVSEKLSDPPKFCQFLNMISPQKEFFLCDDPPKTWPPRKKVAVEALLFVVGFIDINVAKNVSSYFETVSEY